MQAIRHKQTRGYDAHRALGPLGTVAIAVSLAADGFRSPYFQRYTMRKEGPGGNIQLFPKLMVTQAIITGIVSGDENLVAHVQYLNGTTWVDEQDLDISRSYYTDGPSIVAGAIATVLAYAATKSYTAITSAAQISWPNASVVAANRSESSVSLSVQTSTGAVGTQISATQDSIVMVDLSATTTASIAGNAAVDLVLEVASTNSATAGDWVVKGRSGNAQALSLALTLQSVQTVKGQTIAYVPKGNYVKVRSTGITGTVSTSAVEARAVLL